MQHDHYLDALMALETILDRNSWDTWRDRIRYDISMWKQEGLSEQHRGCYGGMGSFNDITMSHPLDHCYFLNIQSIAYALAVKPNYIAPEDIGMRLGTLGGLLSGWVCSNNHEETFIYRINNYVAHHMAKEDVIAYYSEGKLHELVSNEHSGSFTLYEDKCEQITEIAEASGINIISSDKNIKPCTTCGDKDLTHRYWALNSNGIRFVHQNHGMMELPQNIRDVFKTS